MRGFIATFHHVLAVLDEVIDAIIVDQPHDFADQPFAARRVAQAQRRRAEVIVLLVNQPVGVLLRDRRGHIGLRQRNVQAELDAELVCAFRQRA